jgi:hypothetical protein
MVDARERYHVATLTLFNVRLLHEIQQNTSPELNALVTLVAEKNGFQDTPQLLHQGTFFQVAYVCIVWLWESVKQLKIEEQFLREFPCVAERLNVSLPAAEQIQGERNLNGWQQVLRLLRNALSHGKVKVDEENFVFSDWNRRDENAPTYLTLSWDDLGKISESCIHALTSRFFDQQHPAKKRR